MAPQILGAIIATWNRSQSIKLSHHLGSLWTENMATWQHPESNDFFLTHTRYASTKYILLYGNAIGHRETHIKLLIILSFSQPVSVGHKAIDDAVSDPCEDGAPDLRHDRIG
jgi:hypothetical protein